MSGTTPRKPSFTRAASTVSGEVDETHASVQSDQATGRPILGSTRNKLSLVVLCIVYFAANASFSVISPFFPGEVDVLLFRIFISIYFCNSMCIGLSGVQFGQLS